MAEIQVGGDVFRGRPLKSGFLPDLHDWHEEGLGQFSLEDGNMIIDAREGGYTAFYKILLPDDIVVRYTVKSREPWQQNNFNLISHCMPPDPGKWPIVELGRYPGYRTMPNYIMTNVADCEQEAWGKRDNRGRTRVRRNPGFTLNQQANPKSEYGVDYQVTYVVIGGCIHYYINGEKIHQWQDPEPHAGGYFGFRTYCTVAEYRDLAIIEAKECQVSSVEGESW